MRVDHVTAEDRVIPRGSDVVMQSSDTIEDMLAISEFAKQSSAFGEWSSGQCNMKRKISDCDRGNEMSV